MKRMICILLVLVLMAATMSLGVWATEETAVKDGTFSYLSATETIYHYTYHYDESWFCNSSKLYQHDLTKMSLRVAMAAGDIRCISGMEQKQGYENLQALMTDLGFDFSTQHSSYPRSITEADYDNIGYGMGSKTITLDGGEKCTLILVAVRGSGYGAEWGGNFRIGEDTALHEGFAKAADQVTEAIGRYAESISDSMESNVKVWITGYSRAAATANLVAASLTDLPEENELVPGLKDEDIYAFCFACPQNTTATEAADAQYSHIVNVVNPTDLVPKLAMSAWDFGRYGTTYYFPCRETASDYQTAHDAMAQEYGKIIHYQQLSGAEGEALLAQAVKEPEGQASAYDDITASLAHQAKDRGNYVNIYQDDFMDTFAVFMGKANVKVPLSTMKDTLFVLFAAADAAVGVEQFEMESLSYAHYMELCMAWLDSLDGLDRGDYEVYRKVFVNGSADVSVYNSVGKLAAQIQDNAVQAVDNGVVARIDGNGQKIVFLPTDEAYTIRLTAADDGSATYTVAEYNINSGKVDRVVSYFDVNVTKGDEFSGTVNPDAGYSLKLANGEMMPPTIDQSGSEVVTYTVYSEADANGTAAGGGYFVGGEYCRVTAKADAGYLFAGWYAEDELISLDTQYRFRVDSDQTLTARFDHTALKDSAPQFVWADDNTCTASFTCGKCGHVLNVDCEVTVETTPATCTVEGEAVYTAAVEFAGKRCTDTRRITLETVDHAWARDSEPAFDWSDDNTCTVSFTCSECGHVLNVDCAVTVETNPATCTAEGETVYAAAVEFDGKSYSDTRRTTLETIDHRYSDDRDRDCDVCGYEREIKTDILLGDVDGSDSIDFFDGMIILQYYAGIIDDTQLNVSAADVDGNGAVDFFDGMYVLQYYAGILDKLPAEP